MLFLMKQILIHSWFPPTVRGTHEASTSLDVWTFHSCFLILHCQVSIIDVACFQGCKLGYPTTGEQLIKSCHYLGWWKRWREWFGSPQPWHSVLLSLGQGEPSSRLQMRHLPDQILKILLWLNDVLGPDPIYCSGLHFTPWVLSSLRLSSYIPSKYLYNPVLGDVTMTRVSYWWLSTTILLNFIDLLLSELIHNFLS
jgi:hypothetical protein